MKIIFAILCFLYLTYSFNIYINFDTKYENSTLNMKGRFVWQKYNCQSCHQFYGLGGYLGPDLTNVYSKFNRSEFAIKTIIKSGNGKMPAFNLSMLELEYLMEYLKNIDQTGISNPSNFVIQSNGMIN